MAATAVPVQSITTDGVVRGAEVNGDTVNGHSVINDGKTTLIARNSGASPYTVTVAITRTVQGQAVASKVYTVAAGAEQWIGLYPTDDVGPVAGFTTNNAAMRFLAFTRA